MCKQMPCACSFWHSGQLYFEIVLKAKTTYSSTYSVYCYIPIKFYGRSCSTYAYVFNQIIQCEQMIIIDIRLCTIYVLHWICDRRKNLWSEFCRIKITSLFVSSVVLGKIVLCQMINSFVPFNLKNKSQKKKLILKAVQSI